MAGTRARILGAMGADPEFLSRIKLFAKLDHDELVVLSQVVHQRTVEVGDALFRAGEPGDSMFIVEFGAVELFVTDTVGQKIVLHTAAPGDFFGELSLLDGGSRTASAIAVERCELIVLDRDDLLQLFRKKPEAALDMLATMGGMTRKANALLRARVARNVNEEAAVKRSTVDRVADVVATFSGDIKFIFLHIVWFALWVGLNTSGILPFDRYPFGLLTMVVSLEAIFLSCLVLISQNMQVAKDRVRSDVEYEVNIKAELEVAHLHEKTDRIYEDMLERFNRLEKSVGQIKTPERNNLATVK
jgi:CRP/FNR family cyclic AMP-dependent transcriptional regulator